MKEVARILLEKGAVTLNVAEPYTYVSGIRSPIYVDNRRLAAFPIERKEVVDAFLYEVEDMDFDIVAGTATAGIQWAAWIAEELKRPMSYIRGTAKGHGKQKQIEGADMKGRSVLVIEDHVSTGGSSLRAVEACRAAGGQVIAMVAITTYDFKKAFDRFVEAKCETRYLARFGELVETATELGMLDEDSLKIVREWNKDPKGWGPKHGFEPGEAK
jgi:orotate phosphoribosyltransferase